MSDNEIELKGKCGIVNLQRIYLADEELYGFWLDWPGGSFSEIKKCAIRDGYLWLEGESGRFWYIMVTPLDMDRFKTSIDILPLPPGCGLDEAMALAHLGKIRAYKIPILT